VNIAAETKTPRRSEPVAQYDAVVVGAGPYGLSTAAHLLGRGLHVAVFGKPLELWTRHMPKGMLLRSHWWASNLSDPAGQYTFERFLEESPYGKCYPVPRDAFIEYGLWFQRHAVPDVDETYVTSIERRDNEFLVTLEDGRRVRTAAVVMAIGLRYYAHQPAEFRGLPPDLVSHSCDHGGFDRFRGKQVVVIGGGQSAVEYAALLHEAGATVHLVSRRPIDWLARDRFGERSLVERIRAPDAGIGPGWVNWILEHLPYLFYRLPQSRKDRTVVMYSAARATDWLRGRILGKVVLHEGRAVARVEATNGTADVTLSDGERIRADHVILGTGFRVDLDKLPMIHATLRAQIQTDSGTPVLSPSFETTVPGLYFVGVSSWRAFGPLYRFVVGCQAAAPCVARSIARRRRRSHGTPGAIRSKRTPGAAQGVPTDVAFR
jgi:FAD-dependent urate hydroxylase